MPPKRKAVTVPNAQRTSNRTRDKQLQTAAQPLSNAGPNKSKAMSSAPKQNPAKKRGPWGEDYLLTNPKSALVHADLVRLFSNPEAWDCLDEEEKREILSLMPAHIHPNPDPDPENPDHKIPPLPEEFLRYDNNWRAALRNFQSDLEAGRYTPEWQKEAKQAVKERAEGKFDDFKEREFEAFWGQKQKINHGLIAGESSKVKLETLVRQNVVRAGDVWKYCRIFGSRKTGIIVEKEARIIDIDGTSLSFLVPTGQRVFLSAVGEEKTDMCHKVDHGEATLENPPMEIEKDAMEIEKRGTDSIDVKMESNISSDLSEALDQHTSSQLNNSAEGNIHQHSQDDSDKQFSLAGLLDYALQPASENNGNMHNTLMETEETSTIIQHQNEAQNKEPKAISSPRLPNATERFDDEQMIESASVEASESTQAVNDLSTQDSNGFTNVKRGSDLTSEKTKAPEAIADVGSDAPNEARSESTPDSAMADISLETKIRNITGPNALAKKILEIDGRIKSPPNGNSWKEFRCYRNNQDMGSLWEVRQAWYIKNQRG